MTPTPEVEPLPYQRRRLLFGTLVSLFALSLPVFMFYAIGYRFDFSDETTSSIVGTGGMYVTAELTDAEIFINDEPVNDMRIFRSASYIQNLSDGVHKVVVQREGVHTWVKQLSVFPHIVTEAQSFNMPVRPQVRLVTPYLTIANESVLFVATTSEIVLPFASTTNVFYKATSTATSTYRINPEYEFVEALFASTTATSSGIVGRVITEVEQAFQFSSTVSTSSIETATDTVAIRDVTLYRQGAEVWARYGGNLKDIPYYYCVDYVSATSTKERYGDHVYDAIDPIVTGTSTEGILLQNGRTLICRTEIKLDDKRQSVYDFDFFPNNADLVLLLLEDGLYVGEIDDRSWQNTQLLYPGTQLQFIVDGGQIYVRDGTSYIEVLTMLPE